MSVPDAAVTRRDLLKRAGVLGGAALLPGFVPRGAEAAAPFSDVPGPSSPAEALRLLLDGNARFATGRATNPNRTLGRLQELGATQQPFAAILGCSDSRVPVEILFDQGFGDLFVSRVAGNIASAEVIGSLEYSTEVLGSKLVMVLGHTSCGAVKATLTAGAVPGSIGSLYPYIHPAVVQAEARGLEAVIEANVVNQVEILRRASPVVAAGLQAGTVGVVGGVFDFHSGRVRIVAPLLTAAPART